LIPIYKSVSDYNHVWEDALTGSHEHDEMDTLYKQAREIMQPYFQQGVEKALNNYGNQSATQLTSSNVNDVIPAAYYSRISYLFVEKNQHIWGTFDAMENKINYMNETDEAAQDLIDNSVVQTLLNGGEVFLLDQDKMPAKSAVAAVFRY
jgi:hypothetical protein